MSRKYKAKEKKFHKMTRDGLVERNAATGEEQRITESERDFDLRTEQPLRSHGQTERKTFDQSGQAKTGKTARLDHTHRQNVKNQSADGNKRRTKYVKKFVEEAPQEQAVTSHDNPQTIIAPDKPQAVTAHDKPQTITAPDKPQAATAPDKPTEAVKSKDRPNREVSVDPTPYRYNVNKSNRVAPQAVKSHQTGAAAPPGRLQFTKDESKGTKPKQGQNNTKYQQQFISEKAKPDNPASPEILQTNAQSDIRSEDIPSSNEEKAEPTKISESSRPPISKKPGNLQFSRKSKLNEHAEPPSSGMKSRKKQQNQQQRFTPQAEKPEIKPIMDSVSTDKPNKLKFTTGEQANQPTVPLIISEMELPPVSYGIQTKKPHISDGAKVKKLHISDDMQAEKLNAPDDVQSEMLSISDGIQTENPPVSDIPQSDTKKPPLREVTKLREKPKKLQFTKDEQRPTDNGQGDKKLENLKGKADKYDAKLEKARDKLPSKKRSKKERVFDEKKGKAKQRLKFEMEILPPGMGKPVTPAPVTLAKKGTDGLTRMGAGKLHQKVYEVEHENVGVQAGHRAEQAAESVYRGGKRVTRSAFRYVRNRPYRAVEKLEKKAVKANIKYDYRKALSENPKLNSNLLSRYMQKRKIKQQYARAAREAKRTGNAVIKTGDVTARATKAVAGIVRRHPVAVAVIVLILLLLFFITSLFSSFGSMAGGGFSAILASSYLADDNEIDNAELAYTEWETDLLMNIGKTEQDYPGYDEYRYQVDNIEHNPYELVAFLTSAYQDFQYADIEAVLRQIFNEQYTLSVIPSIETRYYEDGDGENIPYDWHILTVTLTSRPFTEVALPHLDTEQISIYSLLMQTKGNRQYIDSPFDFNWLTRVSSYYGYRIHPTSGAKDYHKGIDIAVPVGTEIHAGHDGRVTYAGYSGDYGYVVIIEGAKGLVSKYAHCDSLLVSAGQEVKRSDVIALSGNSGNSTGPHLHLEVIKNGQYFNPLYFAVTNDEGLLEPVYGYPGAPLGDGSYAALIEEAEKYLGMPYVWGGSSPSTSFDCSGFVSWVVNQSGVASFGRTTAQGLYNLTTPVSPSDAQPGDLIFFHSTYSSANPVTHVGIYVGNGMMLHCGNPIQYTSINTSYWQSHFYAFGRLN